MEDNQRKNRRREKRLKKDRRNKIIIWSILAVIVIILVIMRVCEININSVKDHFTDENGNFSLTDGVVNDNFPYSIDSAERVILRNCNNRLGILTPSSFTVINCSKGETEYEFEHGYSNPVVANSGVYTLIYDQSSKGYRLDTTSSEIYKEESENSIFCGDVSKNGTVALATTSSKKQCEITVYKESLKVLFNTAFSDGYVINMALMENSNKLAVAKVSSKNASLVTTICIYNVGNGELLSSVVLPEGALVDIKYSGSNLYVVGDSYIGVIKGDDTYVEVYKAGSISTVSFDYTPSGDLIAAHNAFDKSTENTISVIKASGKIKNEITVTGNIKDVSATSSLVSVLAGGNIYSYSISSGDEKGVITSDESAKSICRLGSEVFLHKQSIIEKSEADNK
ncbi:MAG: DUF5711 family protein [Acetobacter sp.]|nr:DUF5711 family protein [Bacteroides sp.]MCM1340485.1 DUF5711 family protein [Acetobacter sp.]MCM1433225.1 DUF5711 family protein [Clostridiales bacterium]